MQNTNYHACAHPTFPVQDKFGAVLVQFGMSKLEVIATAMCQALTEKNGGQVLPEVLAEEAVSIAISLLDRCQEELVKDTATGAPNLQIIK